MLFLCVLAGLIIQVLLCGGFVWQCNLRRVVARAQHTRRHVSLPIGAPKRFETCHNSRNDDLLGNSEVVHEKGYPYPESSSHKESFTQQQFESFDLGVSWSQFGNAPLSMIHQLLDSRKVLTPQQKNSILDMWADHPKRKHGVSSIRCTFSRVHPSLALHEYIATGNRLKDTSSNSGMASIERGIDSFVAAVKHCGELDSPAVFAYLHGSSGLGKTQLAFALNRRVLYIPFGNAQPIYKSFEGLWEVVRQAINLDLAALREEEMHFQGNDEGVDIFTATHIESAMTPDGQDLAFYTVSVLLKMLELFSSPTYDLNVDPRAGSETNVFLGVDHGKVPLQAMTLNEGRAAAEKYRDILMYFDDVPLFDSDHSEAYDQCLFLRDLIRCMALPCLLSGTESSLLNAVDTVHGSRTKGRVPWAWLFTLFPASRLDLPTAHLSDHEQHLLRNSSPLFGKLFGECMDELPLPVVKAAPVGTWYQNSVTNANAEGGGEKETHAADSTICPDVYAVTAVRDGPGRLPMTPALLSRMKQKICGEKLNVIPPGEVYDLPWLHASTLLVFADSLKDSGAMDTDVLAEGASLGGKMRRNLKMSGVDNIMYHSLHNVPTPLIDANGVTVLYLENRMLQTSNHKPFVARAVFKTCQDDPLLYLSCLRDGLVCRGAHGELVQVPSSYTFRTLRALPSVGNCQTQSNDGTDLESECMAALVLAAHRYKSFEGTPFFDWLALVIAELSTQPQFNVTKICTIPSELRTALQSVLIPLLSPPNCPWGVKNMQSSINYGDLTWCKSADERDARVSLKKLATTGSARENAEGPGMDNSVEAHGYSSLSVEVKDVRGVGAADVVAATKKVRDGSICLLVGSDLSAWTNTTINKFPSDVSVYRINEASKILRVSAPIVGKEWQPGRKVLIALDMMSLHPERHSTGILHGTGV